MDLTVQVKQWSGFGLEPLPLDVDMNGIDIGGSTNSTMASELLVEDVADNSQIIINVTQENYIPYTITITNVYTEDKVLEVILAPVIEDVNDPLYKLPLPFFFTFQDPCSYKSVHYLASSYAGEYKWFVNNECASGSAEDRFIVCPADIGAYQVKMVSTSSIPVQVTPCSIEMQLAWIQVWANTDPGTIGNGTISEDVTEEDYWCYVTTDQNPNVTAVEFKPGFSIAASEPANTQSNRDSSCYSTGETVTITPEISIPASQAISEYTLSYLVINSFNELVAEFSYESPTNDSTLDFTFDSLGDHRVVANLIHNSCLNTFQRELTLEACDFVVVESTECGKFKIWNLSSDKTVAYSVRFLTDEVLTSGTLAPTEVDDVIGIGVDYETSELGIHFIDISYVGNDFTPVDKTYVLNNLCELWDCLAGYVNELICNPGNLCEPCPDETLLNEMVMINMTYSMLMNKYFEFNNFYTLLDESELADFNNVNQMAQKVKELCGKLSCNGISTEMTMPNTFSFGVDTSPKADPCGCGGGCGGETKKSGGCGCGK